MLFLLRSLRATTLQNSLVIQYLIRFALLMDIVLKHLNNCTKMTLLPCINICHHPANYITLVSYIATFILFLFLTSSQGSSPLSLVLLPILSVSFLHSALTLRPSYLAGKGEELRQQKTQTYTTDIILALSFLTYWCSCFGIQTQPSSYNLLFLSLFFVT